MNLSFFEKIRAEFPALQNAHMGRPLIYFDSAATSLKPRKVIERLSEFYSYETSNVHRSAHRLSALATQNFEGARETVAKFLNATSAEEIIFTSGTTDSINLLSYTLGNELTADDEIMISEEGHHSNLVPWQMLAQRSKAKLTFAPLLENGDYDLDGIKKNLSRKTKIVSLSHCSNVLGQVNDLAQIESLVHQVGARLVIDAAQSVMIEKIDVQKMNCDFLTFSGHKIFGPFGTGVLYGKKDLLNQMPPYRGGGSMISEVFKDHSTYLPAPQKFEAGTPNISGAIGLAEAIRFIQEIGPDQIAKHEKTLLNYLVSKMQKLEGLTIYGDVNKKTSILSFNFKGKHNSDLATLLDQQGVAIRAGHHCCQLLMKKFGVSGCARVSLGVYSNEQDVDLFVKYLEKSLEML